jgi:hypothetical protein
VVIMFLMIYLDYAMDKQINFVVKWTNLCFLSQCYSII